MDWGAGTEVCNADDARNAVLDLVDRGTTTDVVFAVEPDLLERVGVVLTSASHPLGVAGVRFADRSAALPGQVIAVAVLARVAAARRAAELAFLTPVMEVATVVEPLRVKLDPAGGMPPAASS